MWFLYWIDSLDSASGPRSWFPRRGRRSSLRHQSCRTPRRRACRPLTRAACIWTQCCHLSAIRPECSTERAVGWIGRCVLPKLEQPRPFGSVFVSVAHSADSSVSKEILLNMLWWMVHATVRPQPIAVCQIKSTWTFPMEQLEHSVES